jgi:hypothetical protein
VPALGVAIGVWEAINLPSLGKSVDFNDPYNPLPLPTA